MSMGISFRGAELVATIPYSFGLAQLIGVPALIGSLAKAAFHAIGASFNGYQQKELALESLSWAGFFALTTFLPIIGAIFAEQLELGPSQRNH